MVSINGTTITLTRGDTAFIDVSITKDGEHYSPAQNDVVRFSVKRPIMTPGNKQYKENEPILIKDIPVDTMVLTIEPSDTEFLDFGEYVYDIQITFSNGVVDTFIPVSKLILAPEVG